MLCICVPSENRIRMVVYAISSVPRDNLGPGLCDDNFDL